MKFFAGNTVTSITVVTFSVIILVTKDVFAATGCPDEWVAFAESCYLGLDGSMTGNWSTAVKQCDRNNASMMVPSSDWENEFVFTQLQHHQHDIHIVAVWINCNDAEVEGEWNCYENGKDPTDYRKWEPDQPDDYRWTENQDYGFMITQDYKGNPDILGYWGDSNEYDNLFIICERPHSCQSAGDVYCLTADESGHFVSRCLFNHTLDRYPTDTVAACRRRCMEHQDCHSFNIKRSSSGSTPRVCELNNANRYQVLKEYFQESDGCNYFDLVR